MISDVGYNSIISVNHVSLHGEWQPDALLKGPPTSRIFSHHCPSGLPVSGARVLCLFVQIHV